jgi:hypothetical protein
MDFLEIDGVEDFDAVVVALKQLANLAYHAALRVGDDIGAVQLHEVGFEKEACLTGTGAADDKHILVSGVLRVFGAVRHHKAFGLREDDIVFKHRVNKWGDVFGLPHLAEPYSIILSVLLGVLAFDIDHKANDDRRRQCQRSRSIGWKLGTMFENAKVKCRP